MIYKIDGNQVLVQIDRSKIIDINVGDTIQISGLSSARYNWTEHDRQLMETNPDADLILKMERKAQDGSYLATELILQDK